MHNNFENLPQDKKDRIIEACLDEFAEKGYDKASTNSIVKKAGISKGILFHYFGNKRKLYIYIIDYILEYYLKEFYNGYSNESSDVFDRLINYSKEKMKLAYINLHMYKIIFEAFGNTPEEVKQEIEDRYKQIYEEHLPIVFEGIDYSRFRKGIDPQKAIELIALCLDGLSKKYLSIYKAKGECSTEEFEKIMEESLEYMEILKGGIYES